MILATAAWLPVARVPFAPTGLAWHPSFLMLGPSDATIPDA